MPAATDAVWLDVLPSMRGFGPALAKGAGAEADRVGKSTGGRFGKAMLAGVAAVGTGAALAAKALYNIGSTFDDVADTIRTGTGATGKALEDLTQSAKNVGKSVPAEFADVGKAIADVNTRLGLTGKPLEDVSAQFLELSRITGTDVAANIENVSRVFGDWGVAAEDQAASLDYLFKVSQSTGIGLDELSRKVVQYGAPMRQFGFSFEESAALMGKWAKEGVNTETIMGGLRQGLGRLAKAGKDPAAAFQEITERIKNAGSEGEATAIAIETFGQRAGPDLAAAVREGRFELDDLMGTLDASGETIMGAGEDTQDFAEQWLMFKNRVLTVIEPIASRVFSALGTGMEMVAQAATAFGNAWKYNDGEITSSGLNGFMERFGYIARQVFDYVKTTVIPALRNLADWLWRNRDVIIPVVAALGAMFAAFKAFMFIKTVIAAVAAFNAVLLANPIGLVVAALAGLVAGLVIAYQRSETFRKIVDTAFRAVAAAGKWMWDNVLKPTFRLLMAAWKAVATAIRWAWSSIIKPVWDAVSAAAKWLWNNVLKGIFSAISGAWDTLSRSIRSIWTNVIKPVFNAFKDIGETVRKAFATAAEGIRKVWAGVKETLKKPIQAVIDVVWNNGLRKMWNVVNNLWGGNDLGTVRLARGGVLPGYTPGRDVHRFVSPTGGALELSGGEAILRPEVTRALGVPTIDMLNALARTQGEAGLRRALSGGGMSHDQVQHFAGGGIVSLPGWLSTALKVVPGGGAISGLLNTINGANLGGGLLGGGLGSLVKNIAGKLWTKAKSLFDGLAKPSGITGAQVGGSGSLGSTYASIFAAVKAAFPQARLNSGFRLGDPGYHGLGRAADLGQIGRAGGNGHPYLADMNRWLHDRFGRNLKELIYTGAGDDRPDIKNGRRHIYSPGVVQTHRNHVHVAVRNGGVLPYFHNGGVVPRGLGANVPAVLAPDERVLTGAQDNYFRRFVDATSGDGARPVFMHDTKIFAQTDPEAVATYVARANARRERLILNGR